MLQILTRFNKRANRQESVEIDRLRIWDYYLLFPDQIHTIKLKREEDDIKQLIKNYIQKVENPYETVMDNRKMFEKIKPYQLTAIKCLASHKIINKEYIANNRVTVVSHQILEEYVSKFDPLSAKENNVVGLLTSHFSQVSMFGPFGLKARTKLLESRYDAE